MRKTFASALILTLAAALGPSAVFAAPDAGITPAIPSDAMTKDKLMSHQVVGQEGENFGDVSNVIMDAQGNPTHLVVKTGGKEVLLPVADVTVLGDTVRVNKSVDDFKKLPEYRGSASP